MDLREFRNLNKIRHPWETSRVKAFMSILKDTNSNLNVLDIGCGDGFVCRELIKTMGAKRVTGVDVNLTESLVEGFQKAGGGIVYLNSLPDERGGRYNLILLLDVLEHMADDRAFLSNVTDKYLAAGGRALVSVPAFNLLFSSHDRFLEHYRRYRLKELVTLAEGSGLVCVSFGYLFTTLLFARIISVFFEKIFKTTPRSKGVGDWRFGEAAAQFFEFIFNIDNKISLTLNRLGIKLPGLSVWVLCEKRQ